MIQTFGIGAGLFLLPLIAWALRLMAHRGIPHRFKSPFWWLIGTVAGCAALSTLPTPETWPLPTGLGGLAGDGLLVVPERALIAAVGGFGTVIAAIVFAGIAIGALWSASGLSGAVIFSLFDRGAEDFDEHDLDDAPALNEIDTQIGRRAIGRAISVPKADPDTDDPEIDDDEEERTGRFAIVGAALHTILSVKSAVRRRLRRYSLRNLMRRALTSEEDIDAVPVGDRVEPSLAGGGRTVDLDDEDAIDGEFDVENETIINAPGAPKRRVKPQAGAPKGRQAGQEGSPAIPAARGRVPASSAPAPGRTEIRRSRPVPDRGRARTERPSS